MSEIVYLKEKRRRGEHFSKADLVFLCELVEKNIAIIRDRPFNLKGGVMVILFRSEIFFRTTQELEYYFFSRIQQKII